jgi:nicotinate-nucleotide adenylyltransferase
MKRIGLMGGTFDPIHYGHLILAEQARDGANLDEVIFMPAKMSPYKINCSCTGEKHRYNMVSLAISGNHGFSISDMEICGSEISYTADTLNALKDLLGSDTKLHFICGTDAFIGMGGWKNKEGIFKNYPIIVGSRPKYKDRSRDEMIDAITSEYGAEVVKVHMPKIDISSSEIKKRLAENVSVRYLLPDVVMEYIRENNLYGNL